MFYLQDTGSCASLLCASVLWPTFYTIEFQSTTMILWIWPRFFILVSYQTPPHWPESLPSPLLTSPISDLRQLPTGCRIPHCLGGLSLLPSSVFLHSVPMNQGAMENFVAPKIFLKFCLLANGSREGQVGKTLSPQLASVSIRGPFLTELF